MFYYAYMGLLKEYLLNITQFFQTLIVFTFYILLKIYIHW